MEMDVKRHGGVQFYLQFGMRNQGSLSQSVNACLVCSYFCFPKATKLSKILFVGFTDEFYKVGVKR